MKYEWWWLYVADKKNQLLISAPLQVCSLKTEEEVGLRFQSLWWLMSHYIFSYNSQVIDGITMQLLIECELSAQFFVLDLQ